MRQRIRPRGKRSCAATLCLYTCRRSLPVCTVCLQYDNLNTLAPKMFSQMLWLPDSSFFPQLQSLKTEGTAKSQCRGVLKVFTESEHFLYLRGMILSGPFLEVISVNSRNILAAFLASDFRLEGIGLFTVQ